MSPTMPHTRTSTDEDGCFYTRGVRSTTAGIEIALSRARFDLERWLDEPDVKLVAVEVYSDYCEPCKAAAPRWEALRKRYKDDGLKLVVINVDDYDSDRQCKTLPWVGL